MQSLHEDNVCTRRNFNELLQSGGCREKPACRPASAGKELLCRHKHERLQPQDGTKKQTPQETAGNIAVSCAVVLSLTCTVKPQRTTAEVDELLMLLA
jgi:hypothetical protein